MKRFSTLFFSQKKEEPLNYHKKNEGNNTSMYKLESAENTLPQRIVEEIYFPRISFLGCPFTWYYYPSHDLVIWTGNLYGTPQDHYDLNALLTKLQIIPEVSIEHGEVAIRKVSDFFLKHDMKYMSQEDDDHVVSLSPSKAKC
ncbi:hypothetical protein Lgra_1336 [Legionella gratiana]|uniref:Uncharacterized protein n=1 Tax=Legionella gratiana TaxID=45066 RepID=A0A378JP29_9GAMM|nr:hypothetical protein [Legionella gratiana]KTD11878.1 hypothetical protein Lgra_1336 [Legionella gratiana]STX46530.1 Uncharacterised protein [Legionella gratiana]